MDNDFDLAGGSHQICIIPSKDNGLNNEGGANYESSLPCIALKQLRDLLIEFVVQEMLYPPLSPCTIITGFVVQSIDRSANSIKAMVKMQGSSVDFEVFDVNKVPDSKDYHSCRRCCDSCYLPLSLACPWQK